MFGQEREQMRYPLGAERGRDLYRGHQVGRIAEQEAGGMGLYEARSAKRPDGDRGVRYQPDGGDQYALMG